MGSLRTLMREAVTSGAARGANLAGAPVYGQVGTARAAAGSKYWAHWFVGYRGGVAFAVLELTKSPVHVRRPAGRLVPVRAGLKPLRHKACRRLANS